MKQIKKLADGWLDILGLEEEYGISKSVQASLRMKKRQTEDEFPLPFSIAVPAKGNMPFNSKPAFSTSDVYEIRNFKPYLWQRTCVDA